MREIGNAPGFLADMPDVGHLRQDLTDEKVKFLQVFSYLIVYDHLARPVGIARVLHASRDIASVLAGR
jgi:toxin ParE1/3/4